MAEAESAGVLDIDNPLQQPLTDSGGISLRDSDGSGYDSYNYTALSRQHSTSRQRQLSASLVSADGGVCEPPGTRPSEKRLVGGDIPWGAMLSHPVVWTLFVQGWVFVSSFACSRVYLSLVNAHNFSLCPSLWLL